MSYELVKLNFVEDKCDSKDVLYSKDLVKEIQCSCYTVKDDLIAAFYLLNARLYDENLFCKRKIKWDDLLPVHTGCLM